MGLKRSPWIALAVGVLIGLVAAAWLYRPTHRGGEDEEEVASPPPSISHGARGESVIALSPGEQRRIGIKTERLAAVVRGDELNAYGVILDPAPLASLEARLKSEAAALKASRAEYLRTRLLHREKQNVSLKQFQAAQASYEAHSAQFNLLRQRLMNQWGAGVAAMAPAEIAELVKSMVARKCAIARVSLPPGESIDDKPAFAIAKVLGHDARPIVTRDVWASPTIVRSLQGQGFMLYLTAQGFPLQPGAAVTARIESSSGMRRGVIVPYSAVVRTARGDWVYVKIAPTRFEQRHIAANQPATSGWFVTHGVGIGDRVVVTGAQSLLSEELKSQIKIED